MKNGENSVNRAQRIIQDCDDSIEFLRGVELDIREQISEAQEELKKITEHINKLQMDLETASQKKLDELCTKRALQLFIKSGGGLDMFVD